MTIGSQYNRRQFYEDVTNILIRRGLIDEAGNHFYEDDVMKLIHYRNSPGIQMQKVPDGDWVIADEMYTPEVLERVLMLSVETQSYSPLFIPTGSKSKVLS